MLIDNDKFKEDIKHVCAWCGVHLCGRPCAGKVSHGVCRQCEKKVLKEVEVIKGMGNN